MGKVVGIAEFKANCTKLLNEMERDGEPITITKRGKRIAELKPLVHGTDADALFGCMRGTATLPADFDPGESGADPAWEDAWDADNPRQLYSGL